MSATIASIGPVSKVVIPTVLDTSLVEGETRIPDSGSQVNLIAMKKSASWKNKRSRMELILMAVLTAFALLAFILIIVVAVRKNHINTNGVTSSLTLPSGERVCLTPVCVQAASRMQRAMDPSESPCENFFQYACGRWNKRNVIPEDRTRYTIFTNLRDDMQIKLKGLLEDVPKSGNQGAPRSAWNLYQSCLNTSHINSRGETPLMTLLDDLGGWPVLEGRAWRETEFDFVTLMAKLRLLNNRVLISQWVGADDKNSSQNIIQLDQAPLGLSSRDFYLEARNSTMLLAYEEYAVSIALELGASESQTRREMKDMVDFEIKLANITIASEERRDTESRYHKYTVHTLYSNVTAFIDWERYLRLVFNNVSLSVERSDEVILHAPQYMKDLEALVHSVDPRTLANYMIWRIVKNRVNNLSKRFLQIRSGFNRVTLGTTTDRPRWRFCVDYVNEHFGMAVGRLFVEENFRDQAKTDALELIHNVRNAFEELLEEIPWMDEATRRVAREKADYITERIGYPDSIMNDTALDMQYEQMSMDPDGYFENVLITLNMNTQSNLAKLNQPVDRNGWFTPPTIVNAYYSTTTNQIVFPAGILQPPFYHPLYPKSLQYGGIGMVIGHEITHGFDDEGRQFDKDGNLQHWWSEEIVRRFKDKAQCIIDQYGNYTVPEIGKNLNGQNTQGENIADNGGIKQAFRAYRQWVTRNGREEDLLPGLDLTHNQLFFLNFAQAWCGHSRPENFRNAVSSGSHSPGRYRVLGTLSNSREFAKAYNCPRNSIMNPEHKCQVW